MTIDDNLISEVRRGNTVLFLGAGASLGARDVAGGTIPSTEALASLINDEFLNGRLSDIDFIQTCDYAATARSGRELQKFIRDTLDPFTPAPFHKLIPTFVWAGLATTNFDLIIERAYEGTPAALQRLRPLARDVPGFADTLKSDDVLYLKLHGCISAFEQVNPGLVYSTERILR